VWRWTGFDAGAARVDYAGFLKAVERDQTPPIVLLHGSEPFFLEDAVAAVTRALFPEGTDLSLLREAFDARDADAESIVRSALLLPWGSARRLVVARGVEGLGAKQGEPLAAYVGSPNPSTVLLLLAGQSLTSSHWLMRVMPAAWIVAVSAPIGRQLVGWLRARARADGFDLDEDAGALLVELSGNDLTRLRGEVEKAALAGGPDNRRVGVAEVRAVVGEHRLRHIFELTRAVAGRDAASALWLLELLLNAGEEPLGVLGMLGREARALLQTAEALRRDRREEEIARALGRPPGAAAAVIERARAMAPGAPARLLERCWETERRLKLSAPARPELSLLVADLCAG
jgi:DNA polymerase-3 subunit delta